MTTIKVDKITPGSGTTTTLGDSGDTFTIPAGVTFANSGSTNMGDKVTYCSTTKSASFTAVANKGYFINTSDASPFLNYAVTVASYAGGNRFYIDGVVYPTLNLSEGNTYRFDQSHSSNANHPLRFSTTSNGTHGGGTEYTTGVTTNGTPGNAGAYTQITVAVGAPTLYYYCSNHSGMGGQANTP